MSCSEQCDCTHEETEPKSYKNVMAFEYKRYMSSLEEAGEAIVQASLLDDEEEDTGHVDHLDRTRSVHMITKVSTSMFWEDYLLTGLGEMITLHSVDADHNLVRKQPGKRSQFETYTSSLRSLFNKTTSSYLMKILLPSYALEDLQTSINIVVAHVNEILKYSEAAVATLEEYLTWIEHGAQQAADYVNYILAGQPREEGEEQEKVEAADLYNDIRVKAYALLKLSDYRPTKLSAFIENIDGTLCAFCSILDIGHRLYATTDPKTFENVFNAMVSKRNCSPKYDGTKFENVHELNEYIRQRLKESVEEPQGFMYNVNELLEEARSCYIDKLATEIIETLAFLPSKKAQKQFVRNFESGRLWLSDDPGV